MSESCFFCGEDGAIEHHHIIPQRFDGPDSEDNLVAVCPTCHAKLEKLYDKSFYEALEEVERDETGSENVDGECERRGCHADADAIIDGYHERRFCGYHNCCSIGFCTSEPIETIPSHNASGAVVCGRHKTCSWDGCRSSDVEQVLVTNYQGNEENEVIIVCGTHLEELREGAKGDKLYTKEGEIDL